MSKYLLLLLLLIGCWSCQKTDDPSILEDEATVVNEIDEDCNQFLISLEPRDSILIRPPVFKPENLSDEFMVDMLKVKISYRITEKRYNSCTYGENFQIINIIKIQKR
jgi:hypothetical protein